MVRLRFLLCFASFGDSFNWSLSRGGSVLWIGRRQLRVLIAATAATARSIYKRRTRASSQSLRPLRSPRGLETQRSGRNVPQH
jgi:hypothetical protein